MSSPKNILVGKNCQILNDVEFLTAKKNCKIILGQKVKIGKRTQMVVHDGDQLIVGDNTSFHSDCSIVGQVTIGRHCLFARHIYISSYDHEFKSNPPQLIKEQDKKEKTSHRVQIDDDCWIGWGVAIKPGIRIGRGAIIGANSVVTKDVAPYSIIGGVPGKLIGTRLPFSPPLNLQGLNLAHTPYFYAGFDMTESGAKVVQPFAQISAPNSLSKKVVIQLLNPLALELKVTFGDHTHIFPPGLTKLEFTPKESTKDRNSTEDFYSELWHYLTLETSENIIIQSVEFQPQVG